MLSIIPLLGLTDSPRAPSDAFVFFSWMTWCNPKYTKWVAHTPDPASKTATSCNMKAAKSRLKWYYQSYSHTYMFYPRPYLFELLIRSCKSIISADLGCVLITHKQLVHITAQTVSKSCFSQGLTPCDPRRPANFYTNHTHRHGIIHGLRNSSASYRSRLEQGCYPCRLLFPTRTWRLRWPTSNSGDDNFDENCK